MSANWSWSVWWVPKEDEVVVVAVHRQQTNTDCVFSLFLVLDFHTPPVHCQHLQRIKNTLHKTRPIPFYHFPNVQMTNFLFWEINNSFWSWWETNLQIVSQFVERVELQKHICRIHLQKKSNTGWRYWQGSNASIEHHLLTPNPEPPSWQ